MKMTRLLFVFSMMATGFTGVAAHAEAEKTEGQKMDRQEMAQKQEQMAKLHGDMANCLKDEKKTLDECRSEMVKNCSMGEKQCQRMSKMMTGEMPMKGHHMKMDGMHGKHKKVSK